MSGPFKMKGSPMQRNFGIGSPLRKTLSEVEVSGGEKSERASDKFKRVKKETQASTDKPAELTKNYGGTWKKGADKEGRTLWLNESGQNVREAAISQSKAKQKKKKEYIKANKTKN